MEYADAVGYLDRWSSSLGACILEAVLWSCVTEGCSVAATDKAREGAYCVRNASSKCRRGDGELEEFSKHVNAAF